MKSFATSTITRMRRTLGRLAHCERGVASIEFMLAIPPLFLMVVLFKFAGYLGVERQLLAIEVRSAAWAESRGGKCGGFFSDITCTTTTMNGDGSEDGSRNIWDQIDAVAGFEITQDVRQARYPAYVTAKADRPSVLTHPWITYGTRLKEEFTVGNNAYFGLSEDAIRPGYDNVLRKQIRDLSDGGTGELYDGVFPGAK